MYFCCVKHNFWYWWGGKKEKEEEEDKLEDKSIRETLFYSFQFSAEIFDNKA